MSFVMQCGGFFIYPKVKGNKIQNGGGKDIGFPFRRVKAGIKKAVTQKKCSAELSTEIASIGLCQPQSNPHPKGVWTNLGDNP